MVNIYKYIRSSDVRKYLKRNDYRFSLVQKYFLIGYDRGQHTLEERKKDYQKLLKEYKYDMKFKKIACPPPEDTVMKCIRRVLEGKEEDHTDCFEYIPLPFKPGDIVIDIWDPGIPKIIMENGYEDQRKIGRSSDRFHQYDEPLVNCFYYVDGLFYYDHVYAMDIEYYRGKKSTDYYRLKLIRNLMTKRSEKYDLVDFIVANVTIANPEKVNRTKGYWGQYALEEVIGEKETERILEAGKDSKRKKKNANKSKDRKSDQISKRR